MARRHQHRGERIRGVGAFAREDLRPAVRGPGIDAGARRLREAPVAGEHILQTLLLEHVERGLEAEEEVLV